MIIYPIHEATGPRGLLVEWLYYVGDGMWLVDSMVFERVVYDHNARN